MTVFIDGEGLPQSTSVVVDIHPDWRDTLNVHDVFVQFDRLWIGVEDKDCRDFRIYSFPYDGYTRVELYLNEVEEPHTMMDGREVVLPFVRAEIKVVS